MPDVECVRFTPAGSRITFGTSPTAVIQRTFLFRFARERRRYLHWLFEARKRFGLCVLDYIVTSNHVHLLIKDTGSNVIAESMQLIAGRTAQEYNERKARHGAFWEELSISRVRHVAAV